MREGGGLCAWRAQITSGCFSLVTPWVTIAAGMLRKSISTQLTLRSGQDRGQEAECLQSQRIRVNKCFWKVHYVPGTVLGIGDTEKNVKEQGSLPRWNLHLHVKKQMASHKQTNPKKHTLGGLLEGDTKKEDIEQSKGACVLGSGQGWISKLKKVVGGSFNEKLI